jgi:WD40 repeat protein
MAITHHTLPPERIFITSHDHLNEASRTTSAAFSPDETTLAIATGDELYGQDALWLWDIENNTLLSFIDFDAGPITHVVFNRNGSHFALIHLSLSIMDGLSIPFVGIRQRRSFCWQGTIVWPGCGV